MDGRKTARWIVALTCAGVFAALLPGCSLLPVILDMSDNGAVRSIEVGDTLEIRLEGNASTGYQWVRVEPTSFGDGPLEIVEEGTYRPEDPGVCGGPGVFTYRYRAVVSGTATLSFVYRRPWEDETIDEYSVITWVK